MADIDWSEEARAEEIEKYQRTIEERYPHDKEIQKICQYVGRFSSLINFTRRLNDV